MSNHVAPNNVDPHEPVVAHSRSSPTQTRISGLLLAAGAVAWSVGAVIVGDRVGPCTSRAPPATDGPA
ncbi:hypothetical protein [Nonomuraea bangladeshensis]|uniref:hypothetical protein n=1 Tax=Nonomuraea bangladeshensis TaxID=404385 RepID=UPI0031CFBF06